MRKFALTISALALALACQISPCHASAATGVVVTSTTSATNGPVTLAVSTSGYAFTPLIGVLDPPPASGATTATALPPQGFTAAVTLQNHSNTGIACALGVTGTPGQKFVFNVYNANGKLVWTSLPSVLPPLEMLATLGAGDSWHGTVFVPLFIKGVALPAGTYTLEASLFGSPAFSATTSFVVKNVIAIN
jgi:hypothetical protein